jgi:hypothetical protein
MSRKERWRSKGDGYSAANSEGVAIQRQSDQGRSNVAWVRRAAYDRRRRYTGLDGITADGEDGGITGSGGLSGIESERSRVRAEVLY